MRCPFSSFSTLVSPGSTGTTLINGYPSIRRFALSSYCASWSVALTAFLISVSISHKPPSIFLIRFLFSHYGSPTLHSSAARGLFHRAADFYHLFLLHFIDRCCNWHVSNPLCRCIYCCRSRNCIEYNNNSKQNNRQAPLASKIPCNQFHIQKTA